MDSSHTHSLFFSLLSNTNTNISSTLHSIIPLNCCSDLFLCSSLSSQLASDDQLIGTSYCCTITIDQVSLISPARRLCHRKAMSSDEALSRNHRAKTTMPYSMGEREREKTLRLISTLSSHLVVSLCRVCLTTIEFLRITLSHYQCRLMKKRIVSCFYLSLHDL